MAEESGCFGLLSEFERQSEAPVGKGGGTTATAIGGTTLPWAWAEAGECWGRRGRTTNATVGAASAVAHGRSRIYPSTGAPMGLRRRGGAVEPVCGMRGGVEWSHCRRFVGVERPMDWRNGKYHSYAFVGDTGWPAGK